MNSEGYKKLEKKNLVPVMLWSSWKFVCAIYAGFSETSVRLSHFAWHYLKNNITNIFTALRVSDLITFSCLFGNNFQGPHDTCTQNFWL
jgi:hypothetical protein